MSQNGKVTLKVILMINQFHMTNVLNETIQNGSTHEYKFIAILKHLKYIKINKTHISNKFIKKNHSRKLVSKLSMVKYV